MALRLQFRNVVWTDDTYPHGRDIVVDGAIVREVRVVGDFEGVVTIAIGISQDVCPTFTHPSGPPVKPGVWLEFN